MRQPVIIVDCECDGFYLESKAMWVLVAKEVVSGESIMIHPYKNPSAGRDFLSFLSKFNNPLIVFHNGLGYDIFVMRKFLGIDFTVSTTGNDRINGFPVRFVDTYFMSMYLLPDRQGHSLEAWGERLGFPKMDWRGEAIKLGLIEVSAPSGAEFAQHHSRMDEYCTQDVAVTERLFSQIEEDMKDAYKHLLPDHYVRSQKGFFLNQCQGITAWHFNKELALEVKERLAADIKELKERVDAQLPTRPLKKGEQHEYTMPAKPFKKDGSLSSHMLNFIEKHGAKVVDERTIEVFGKQVAIESKKLLDIEVPMTIEDQDAIKEYLLGLGWKPDFWNYQKDSNGKPVRGLDGQYIQTSPKMQEAGKICPNLEAMEIPIVVDVKKYLSLRNRHSVISGWLEHPRLALDGRLPSNISGIAASHRQKHSTVVNIPKAQDDVLYGKEFRSLFCAGEGNLIAAADAAALEARVMGHYTYKYDDGAFSRLLLEGDIHSVNMKAFFPDETRRVDITSPEYNKDGATKKYRSKSKNGFYAVVYGCSPPKLAKTLGQPEQKGQAMYDAFWAANPALKKLKEQVEIYWKDKGGKKKVPAIDGRLLMTRSQHAILNTLFQSAGAIVMDYAAVIMDYWLGGIRFDEQGIPHYIYKGKRVQRVAYMHDELEFECEEAVAQEVADKIVKAIELAGVKLKFKLPLAGEAKVGKNWREVH